MEAVNLFDDETVTYSYNPATANNKIPLLCISSDESEEESEEPNPDWTYLPEPIIDHVYSFLSRNDQSKLSLTCRRWSKSFNSPPLWRNFKFYLPEHDYLAEVYPEVRFARKFGHFFRRIEIICKRVRSHLLNETFIQLKLFLEALIPNNQLHSVSFVNLLKFFRHLDEEDYVSVLESTMNFLEAQRNLKTLQFHETFYRPEEGAELLQKVCNNNSGSLSRVVLKGFVTDPVSEEEMPAENIPLYSSLKQHFMNISSIHTDYTQLFEDVIESQLDNVDFPEQINTKRNLSLLNITCEGTKRLRFQGITPPAWKCLKRLCPELKVHMSLTTASQPRIDYRFFIVEYIPLQQLELRVSTPHEVRNLELGDFFQHLQTSKCNEHLENITVLWMPRVDNLSSSLVPFVRSAPKLRTLQIFLRFPVAGIEAVFQSWLEERPPSLESAHISINRVRQEEDSLNIMRLADEYTPLLQVLGLNVILVVDSL